MNPRKFQEAIWLKNRSPEVIEYNEAYRKKHPEFEQFDMPEVFWFKIYQEFQVVHWAVVRKFGFDKVAIYFININGRAFDRLIMQSELEAERLLRKSNFISSKKKEAPYLPIEPVFISLIKTKKKALYSKAGLLNYKVKKEIKIKIRLDCIDKFITFFIDLRKTNPCKYKILVSILIFLYVILCLFIGFKW